MLKKKILLVFVAIVVIFALVVPGCIPKKTETAKTTTTNAVITTEEWAALKADVKGVRDKQASLPSPKDYSEEITALDDKHTAQQKEIDALKERIATLETQASKQDAKASGNVDPEDAVTVDARYYANYVITLKPREAIYGGDPPAITGYKDPVYKPISLPVSLKLTNELDVGIEDIILWANVNLRSTTGSLISRNHYLVGDAEWYRYGMSGNTSQFESWGAISIKAGDRKSYQLTFSAEVANDSTATDITAIIVAIYIVCEDYGIVR